MKITLVRSKFKFVPFSHDSNGSYCSLLLRANFPPHGLYHPLASLKGTTDVRLCACRSFFPSIIVSSRRAILYLLLQNSGMGAINGWNRMIRKQIRKKKTNLDSCGRLLRVCKQEIMPCDTIGAGLLICVMARWVQFYFHRLYRIDSKWSNNC